VTRVNTARWNRLRYSLYAPVYDRVRFFTRQRRRSVALLDPRPGERLLLVGAGPAHDLELVPEGVRVLVTDVAPGMIARARRRARPGVEFAVMDGAHLDLPDASFDAVLLHLVLAVMPDPAAGVREVARVLVPGGRVVVFDKFLADGARPGILRRAANVVSDALATNLNRRLGDVLGEAAAPLAVVHDEAAAMGGYFRIVELRKPGVGPVRA
jgi:phosphatidylethanolamine/phosphatidyl-N-methylethanolamine N-methyltransferase